MKNTPDKPVTYRTFFLLAGILGLCGCGPTPETAVRDTDERVYGAIERAMDRAGTEYNEDHYLADSNSIRQMELNRPWDIPMTGIVTLPQATAMAIAGNREYLLERDNLYILATGVTEIQHLYEPIPFGSVQESYTRQNGQEDIGTEAGFGLSQLLATGAQVGTQMTLGWMDILSGGDGMVNSGFSTVFSAIATQPLLRGSSRKAVFETLTQAEQDLLYQVRYFNRYRKTFMVSVVQTYYETLQLNDQMNNAFRYYLRISDIYRQTQKQAAVGRVPLYEVEQTYQDQLDAMDLYLDISNDYGQTLDFFKTLLAVRPDVEFQLDRRELDALKAAGFSELEFTEEDAIRAALSQRLDLANAADRILDAQRHVEVAAEMLGTDLSLIGATSVRSFGASADDLRRTEDLYNLSLRLDLPLDRLAEKNRYRLTLVELMQNQRTHQQVTDTVILEVRAAFRDLQTAHEQYRVALHAQELAQKRTENTLRLQQVGRANMRDVLDAQEDYYNAQDAATDTLVEYTIASLKLFLATDTLKIKPDGMWETNHLSGITLTKKVPASSAEKQDTEAIVAN
jgi:outer membrane protein TolC